MSRFPFGCVLLGVAALPLQGAGDAILPVEGRKIRGVTILADTFPEVRYKRGASEETIPASLVLDIEWADAPPVYRQALEKRRAGDFDGALRALDLARETSGVRPWLAEYVDFERATVLEQWGALDPARLGEAEAAYGKFADAYPSSRRYPEAYLGRARCLRLLGRHDEALTLFSKVAEEGPRLGEVVELEATLGRAETLLAADRPGESRGVLRALEGRVTGMNGGPTKFSSLLRRARLLFGECLLAERSIEDARAHFVRLGAEAGADWRLRLGARAREGEALLALNKVREAALAFGEVAALEPLGGEEAPRALFGLGECYNGLVGQEPEAERRARAYYNDVVRAYPGSVWAARARERLR